MAEKIKYKKKAIVGKRQLVRRAKEAELSVISNLQENITAVSVSSSLVNLPCTLYNNSQSEIIVSQGSSNNSNLLMQHDISFESQITTFDDEHSLTDSDSVKSIKDDFKTELKHWATQYQIPHNALNSLIKIVSPLCDGLPKDSRTLLTTPLQLEVTKLDTGELIYLGLLSQIKKQIKLFDDTGNNVGNREIKVSFNIDGLPLFKSTNTQLWPILGLLKNNSNPKPFVVALFCGRAKPSPLDVFLKQFVDELEKILRNGFDLENVHYTVKIHSFICDAPARAFIKCTKQHGGYSACDKCVEAGEYRGRVIYESVSAPKRTNESFRSQLDEDHHVGESPLLRLPIDLISLFPTEYMHNVCLGVMRKLLNVWISGDLKVRVQSHAIKIISEKLIYCSKFIPVEFNRKPRCLSELARWKATEYRMFLLYVGPFVLKDILPRSLYENFLVFHSAITILCSNKHISELGINLAQELLLIFINHSKSVYGLHFLVYNVHMLCHICDDVRLFGTLDEYSAFPFENHLKSLKKLVRSPNKPLQQIVRRLKEMESLKLYSFSSKITVSDQFYSGPLPEENVYECYKKLIYKKYTLYVAESREVDCYCLTKDKKVFKIHNILKNHTLFIYGKEFLNYQPFFEYPFNSVAIDVMVVKNYSRFKLIPVNDILTKCVVIHYNDYTLSIPMLHDYYCDR